MNVGDTTAADVGRFDREMSAVAAQVGVHPDDLLGWLAERGIEWEPFVRWNENAPRPS